MARTAACAGVGVVLVLVAGAAVGVGVFYALRDSLEQESSCAPKPPCPELEVAIDSGKLRGACRPAMQGRPRYAAFMHVPYARPPLKDLRFKSPRPVEPWDGVRNATVLGPKCLQGSEPGLLGDEDCLHVNVYSAWLYEPRDKRPPLLPVLMHVHGGGNRKGSGNQILPDYFVGSGLVVVTFNYRLGGNGFLSLDDDDVPGNVAFKDMVAAMQWVHRNVHNFGGDPDRVTINGCSSAAVAVHWLTLLPATEGLFRAAIIKSGSALTTWAYSEGGGMSSAAGDFAQQVLAFLRKWMPDTHDDAQRLQTASPSLLGLAYEYAEAHLNISQPGGAYSSPFITLEKRRNGSEPKLIERDPESYILDRARSSVPLMIGRTACEVDDEAQVAFMLGKFPDASSDAFMAVLPVSVVPQVDARRILGLVPYSHLLVDAAADFRAGLFNTSYGDPQCDLLCRWENLHSGNEFNVGTVRAARMHARRLEDPVYAYNYDFYAFPVSVGCPTHAQDDHMVWPEIGEPLLDLRAKNARSLNVLRTVTMFANFVKFLNPVPQTDGELLTTEWPRMNKDGPDVYLSIGENLTLKHDDLLGRFGPFWTSLYTKFRDGKGI